MIGQVLFAVWIAAVTIGGLYYGQQFAGTPSEEAGHAEVHVRYNDFKTDLFAIPYVNETGIVGYVTGRFTVKTIASMEDGLMIPLGTVIYDALSRHFYDEAANLASPVGWTHLRESLDQLRDLANKSAGREVVAEVLIEQLDFFDKNSVRSPGDARYETVTEN